jgi:hypothetical protein
MEKKPVEIFVADLIKQAECKSVLAKLGVHPDLVGVALVCYLKDQGVHFVTDHIAQSLASRLTWDLEHRQGFDHTLLKRVEALSK